MAGRTDPAPARDERPFVAVGELLWDLLPDGPRLGGAPFNVVAHGARLGRPAKIVSAVGRDELGERARSEVAALRVDASWLSTTDAAPTGTAGVALDDRGSPTFRIAHPAAYEFVGLSDRDLGALVAMRPAAIVVGTLAQRSPTVHAATQRLVAACPDALRLYDANLRDGLWDADVVRSMLGLASVVKLSAAELEVASDVLGLGPRDLTGGVTEVARQTGALAVCVTNGAAGATLLVDGQLVSGLPPPVTVIDAVGAGDAFAAALLDGLVGRRPPEVVLQRALALGALVASRAGAVPAWAPDELERMLAATPLPNRAVNAR
jgi:fructokinase